MAGSRMAIDLKPRGIALPCFHPGLVEHPHDRLQRSKASQLSAWTGPCSPASTRQPGDSGSFWHANGQASCPWLRAGLFLEAA